MSSVQQLLDTAGRRRSPATLSAFHVGRSRGNKGQRYAADRRRSMSSSRSCATLPTPGTGIASMD
jgi:hypothetical protein